jgi:restriction endonuclease Mrr
MRHSVKRFNQKQGNAVRKTDQQVIGLIERFEADENLCAQEAKKLVVDIFVGCGLPALHRGGPGDQGVDVEFTTDDAHGVDRFAVQVKTSSRPVGVTDVQTIAGAALTGGFDRWLFVSRSGFTEQARDFASAVRLIKLELLSPAELRRWITNSVGLGPQRPIDSN